MNQKLLYVVIMSFMMASFVFGSAKRETEDFATEEIANAAHECFTNKFELWWIQSGLKVFNEQHAGLHDNQTIAKRNEIENAVALRAAKYEALKKVLDALVAARKEEIQKSSRENSSCCIIS